MSSEGTAFMCDCPAHDYLGRECLCFCDHSKDVQTSDIQLIARYDDRETSIGRGKWLIVHQPLETVQYWAEHWDGFIFFFLNVNQEV